ncbi:MAG: AMP-binding protein [Chthoniobacterales bacterium]|nr:AMP-binding protein [Chthoniobacterales bacterium]
MSERLVSATIAELFLRAGKEWGSRPAFATRSARISHPKRDKKTDPPRTQERFFPSVSYRSWCDRACDLATALIDIGVAAREHVGLLSDNRFEWILADAAIQFCGAADVPRGSDITPLEMSYILDHAEVQVLFLENEGVLVKLQSIRKQLPFLKTIILMEVPSNGLPEGILTMNDLEERGRKLRALGDRRMEIRVAEIVPDDLCTLIYTSGTTGTPKGVPITHRSLCSQIENITFHLSKEERALSILPIWHSYERVFEMLVISYGATLYYSSLRHLQEDLKTIRPTVMASAPRLWEALYEKIMASVAQQQRVMQFLFHAASRSAHWVRHAVAFFQGMQLNLTRRTWKESLIKGLHHILRWSLGIIPFLLLEPLVLRRLRNVIGGSFRATISGGGALPPHIDSFFNDIGIRIFEGYGLTESAPVLAVRTEKNFVLGTVGPPLPKTEIKIIDLLTGKTLYPDKNRTDLGRGRSGEICARGPQIMKGYYKNPEATARVLSEGWLRTGDIGMMTFNDCLKIIGRCKETIVLRSGENVEPLPIESRLLESPLIEQCIVLGQDQKHLGALLLPSLRGFINRGFNVTSLEELLHQQEIHALLHHEIQRLISKSQGFKSFERIGCWSVLPKPFEVGDELTSTYKLKRHIITDRYHHLIQEMYENHCA